MVINVHFQNVGTANSEILKAFNSSTSSKALEAYQPLTPKERKLEKLRALQILKQSSESETLADISLSTGSLGSALQNAEGATLQAMLNLLSAKMIEQNKYVQANPVKSKEVQEKIKFKVKKIEKEENQDQQQKEQAKDEEADSNSLVGDLVKTVEEYFDELGKEIKTSYKEVLNNFSFNNLKSSLEKAKDTVINYLYEKPSQAIKENIVEPIEKFSQDFKREVEIALKYGIKKNYSKVFSSKDIKNLLKEKSVGNEKLEQTISGMNSVLDDRLILKTKVYRAKQTKAMNAKEFKMALHK